VLGWPRLLRRVVRGWMWPRSSDGRTVPAVWTEKAAADGRKRVGRKMGAGGALLFPIYLPLIFLSSCLATGKTGRGEEDQALRVFAVRFFCPPFFCLPSGRNRVSNRGHDFAAVTARWLARGVSGEYERGIERIIMGW